MKQKENTNNMENLLDQLPASFEYSYLPPVCSKCGEVPYRDVQPEIKTARLEISKWPARGNPLNSSSIFPYEPAKWHIRYYMESEYFGVEGESLKGCVESMLSKLKVTGRLK